MEQHFLYPTILVTGANGQLGRELQKLSAGYSKYRFLFASRETLPIDDEKKVTQYFEAQQIDYCINCAAYTAVDKAETEKEAAFRINATAVGDLARICKHHQAKFIHISTDYVFDGKGSKPYKEDDAIAPLNVYGTSKLKGEELAFNNNAETLIIRTSWVYSSFGNNFVKTMIRLLRERTTINVVNDQHGCPTYAADLAAVIITIIEHSNAGWIAGIINYCNAGITSWFEFACAIKEIIASNCIIEPMASAAYITAAQRPQYSVLDTGRIHSLFGIDIPQWPSSLKKCLLTLT